MTRTRHRVAIVVFADCEGVDERDASYVAELAIRSALTGDPRNPLPINLPIPLKKVPDDETARVVDVMDAGTAIGNGYLWTRVTSKAWRNHGLDIDPAPAPTPEGNTR